MRWIPRNRLLSIFDTEVGMTTFDRLLESDRVAITAITETKRKFLLNDEYLGMPDLRYSTQRWV